MLKQTKITIIGAGAAGIGFATALKNLGVEDFIVLEKETIGHSFLHWPKHTRFITPSFTTNGFGFPDLNAVVPDTSPAFTFQKEHLSGLEYAQYLKGVAKYYQLPVEEHRAVKTIEKTETDYQLTGDDFTLATDYLIFATGEYDSPNTLGIKGSEHGMHYSAIDTIESLPGRHFHVIGANESGIDLATQLFFNGKNVNVYSEETGIDSDNPDPSIKLAPITNEKFHLANQYRENIPIHTGHTLKEIRKEQFGYTLIFTNGETVYSATQPLLATGFEPVLKRDFNPLFTYHANSKPILTAQDESTQSPNAFVIGPSVQQHDVIFCYIYKFRQRFVPIIETIAQREGWELNQGTVQWYRDNSMSLINLDTCCVNCDC